MNDPEGATEDGANASSRLEAMAWAAGWTKEQTAGAADWAQVGDMALNAPTAGATPSPLTPAVGSKWLFAKRDKSGDKLKNKDGIEFPPQEVEVVSVDEVNNTCTLVTVKDRKPVVDIRSKKLVDVKFEYLEGPPY